VRIVLAEDEVLLREGLARLLTDAGFEVVGKAGDAAALLRLVDARRPELVLTDIRMPPTHSDEGLQAAGEIGRRHPGTGVLVLSHYLESGYALRLLEDLPERSGYLLKDRVSDVAVLTDALRRIGQGECVIDPTIVSRLLARHHSGPLADLTAREREILAMMAEGHSNDGICRVLFLSPKTVEGHIHQIFLKLDLGDLPSYNRRVLAVLRFLRPG
jgi:DNA-binding NarL/FixJ family response regulator